jgi:hypothetical protein
MSCSQNLLHPELRCRCPWSCYATLGPPLPRRPRPYPAAPPSTLPCCCTRSEGRRLELCPLWRSQKWVNPLVVHLLFSTFDVARCSYHPYCVLIHVSCLAQWLIHIYQYICQYMTIWVYIPWSVRRWPDRTTKTTRVATSHPSLRPNHD